MSEIQAEATSRKNGLGIAATALVSLAIAVYFSLPAVVEFKPSIAASGVYFFYLVSMLIVIPVLMILGAWGIIGIAFTRFGNRPLLARHVVFALLACVGFVSFFGWLLLAFIYSGGLPVGSRVLKFDSKTWRDTASSENVRGDITPRQKMLYDTVYRVLPGSNQSDIERLLGPSLEGGYFESTSRDLIYEVGPERDGLFRVDSEWLLIWLDGQGRFERFDIAHD